MDSTLNRRPASELAALIRSKAVSPVEVLQAHLLAIEKLNPKVNAICTLAADAALAAARKAETAVMKAEALGPLHGIPIGIKDVTPTAGLRTTFGSPLHADNIPAEDAAIVKQLKKAGAIIVGKTNTPEFAAGANTVNRLFGATRNPRDFELTAGGSTGGGAAALACGLIALAEGTDFGGSLRVPAAFCGVVGLRPTPGIVPVHPVPLPWDMLSVHGPMARNAADTALMLEAIATVSRFSPISMSAPWRNIASEVAESRGIGDLRVGYAADIAGVGVDPVIAAECRRAAAGFAGNAGIFEELEFSAADGRGAFLVLRGLTMVGRFLDRLHDDFEPNLRGNIEAGLKLTAKNIAAAERKRAELWERWRLLFERIDVLLTPTTPVAPFPVAQNYPPTIAGRKMETYIDWIAPTFLVTLASLPAASVPCGFTPDGLPVGLQIIGPRFSEPKILRIAKFVEEMNPVGWPSMTQE